MLGTTDIRTNNSNYNNCQYDYKIQLLQLLRVLLLIQLMALWITKVGGQEVANFQQKRLRVLNISILPLNSVTSLYFWEKNFCDNGKIFRQAKIFSAKK